MTAIFISHRSADNAEAQALKDWLGEQGHEQLFLDFDPADGIPAGVDWEQRLYQELRRCQALLIVLTPAWLESKWCGNELAIAREKGKAVFVVRVKPCPGGPLIPAVQEVDLALDREATLEKLARGLKEHGLDPRDAFDWKPERPIYPGLAAFNVDDAAIFFGRSEESWQSIEALRRMRLQATGSPKLLLMTGASGSGKSSLMRAGVLARLRKEPASWIAARPFRRGTDALAALADALAWAFPRDRRPTSLEATTARLSGPDGAAQLIVLTRELRLALDRPEATLVLALDQAEELLAAGSREDAAQLLDLFRATLAAVGNEILVIATIRSDRLGAWQQHASIKATADHGELPFEMLPLGPMPMARIGEIVRGPAAYEGLRIDDDLVDAIRADTGTPDALPLLAYTLQYLHRQFAGDGRLTLAEYQSLGGLEGSVRSQADAAIPIEKLSEDDRRALQEAFVPGLVRATAQGGFSRSRALLASLPARAEPHLRRLIDEARLLTTDTDPQGGATVEVAHESLLDAWPTLARWIAEDADSLRRLEAMQRAAQDWANAGRGEDFLVHRDHRLSDAEALIAKSRFAARLDNPERGYLAACRNAQNQREAAEKEAQERELRAAQALAEEQKAKMRRTRVGLTAACVLLVVAFGLGLWGWDQAGEAERQSQEATKQKVEVQRQLDSTSQALATGLWSDLDFSNPDSLDLAELKALWALAVDDGLVRVPFVVELSDKERTQRFARRPGPVSRALGLAWPAPQQAREVLGPVIGAMGATPTWELPELVGVVQALPVQLDAAQVEAVLDPVLDAIKRRPHPRIAQHAEALQWLAEKLSAGQAEAALGAIVIAIKDPTSPEEIRALAEALQALPVQLDAAQAEAALAAVLDAISDTSFRYALADSTEAVRALSGKLDAEQSEAAIDAVLIAIKETDDPDQLQALGVAAQALAMKLDAEQADAILGAVLAAVNDPSSLGELRALAETAKALSGKLDAEQRGVAVDAVLDVIKGTDSPYHLQALAETVQALATKLDAEQADAVLGPVLAAVKDTTTSEDELRALAETVRALPAQLDPSQVEALIRPILDAIRDEAWVNTSLLEAVQALSGKLEASQARAALGTVLATIKDGTSDVIDLIETVQALPVQLDAAQIEVVLGVVLEATTRHADDANYVQALTEAVKALARKIDTAQALDPVIAAFEGTTDSDQLWVLAEAVQALPVELHAAQAQAALGPVLDAIQNAADFIRKRLAKAIKALAGKLDEGQAQVALGAILVAIVSTADTDPSSSGELRALAEAVRALAGKLDEAQAQAALAAVRPALAWASTSDVAAGWAEAFVTLLPRGESELSVAEIVEVLKYPTSAGVATDGLLDALRGIDSSAPGKEAGLAANLAWLSTAYPAIDLDKPPDCPKQLPNQQDITCPVGTR